MRTITKDITLPIDGEKRTFRLTKPDAFSGVEILRLLLRMQEERGEAPLTVLDFVTRLSDAELRSVMASCLNHVSVLLPAGPNPVLSGSEWGYPELEHDAKACVRLTLELVSFTLSQKYSGPAYPFVTNGLSITSSF